MKSDSVGLGGRLVTRSPVPVPVIGPTRHVTRAPLDGRSAQANCDFRGVGQYQHGKAFR